MIGCMVGVGFVTGAEVFQFFARFKINFIFGIILFFVLTTALSYKIFIQNIFYSNELKMQNLNQNLLKNTFLTKFNFKEILTILNLFLISAAMFSGLKNLLQQLFFHNHIIIFLVASIFVFVVLLKGVNSLLKVNVFVVLFLLFILFCLSLTFEKFNCLLLNEFSFKNITLSCVFSAIYIFMNIVTIEPVIKEKAKSFTKKECMIVSILFALLLTIMLVIIALFLMNNLCLTNSQMPILEWFKQKGGVFAVVFEIGLVVGLLSTLVGCLFGVKNWLTRQKDANVSVCFLLVLAAMTGVVFEFSFYVSWVYPLIGILNFLIYVFW